jgi:hypothetical protein
LDAWDSQLRGIVSDWFKVKNIPTEIFQMSWRDGGFSFPSLRERQNTLVIRTVLDMITSPDEITRALMRQFEIEQAKNCGIEWRERPPDHNNRGFLNWNPTIDQQKWRAGAPTQSIFPRAFQAHQEDDISLWVEKGQTHLTHPIAEPFAESKIARPAMWITQSVRRMMHKENFKHRCAI